MQDLWPSANLHFHAMELLPDAISQQTLELIMMYGNVTG